MINVLFFKSHSHLLPGVFQVIELIRLILKDQEPVTFMMTSLKLSQQEQFSYQQEDVESCCWNDCYFCPSKGLGRPPKLQEKESMQWHPGWAGLLIHGTIKKRKLGVPCSHQETFENLRSKSSKIFSKY